MLKASARVNSTRSTQLRYSICVIFIHTQATFGQPALTSATFLAHNNVMDSALADDTAWWFELGLWSSMGYVWLVVILFVPSCRLLLLLLCCPRVLLTVNSDTLPLRVSSLYRIG